MWPNKFYIRGWTILKKISIQDILILSLKDWSGIIIKYWYSNNIIRLGSGLFLWIIVYNFVVFQPNLKSRCVLMPTFCVRQSDDSFTFYGKFYTLTKRRKTKQEKNKENQPIFESSYLKNFQHDLVKIWMVSWCWHFRCKKLSSFIKLS